MTVSILIPILNEADTVLRLLNQVWTVELPDNLRKEIVIVDNGSTDGSYGIAVKFAEGRENTATGSVSVLRCPVRGKGAAVRMGIERSAGEIILIQDGDLEYDVQDYPSLLKPILDGRARFVLGSRHLSAGNWKIRRFRTQELSATLLNVGGVFFHGLFNLVYGVHLTDPTTMYKVFLRDAVRGLTFRATRFDFDLELVAKLIRSGSIPLEVPVSYRSRDFREGKKISFAHDSWRFLRTILRVRWERI